MYNADAWPGWHENWPTGRRGEAAATERRCSQCGHVAWRGWRTVNAHQGYAEPGEGTEGQNDGQASRILPSYERRNGREM